MDPIATFGAALGLLKTLSDLLVGLTKLKLDAEVSRRIFDAMRQATEVQQQLFDAQNSLFELRLEN